MPSDVFWTGLFTFAGGSVGAAGGYLGVRSQRKGDEEKLLRGERNEAREQRRRICLAYLAAFDALRHAPAIKDLTADGLDLLWRDFGAADAELELAGTEEVKDASYEVHPLARQLGSSYREILVDPAASWPDDAFDDVGSAMDKRLSEARAKVITAMRADFRPD